MCIIQIEHTGNTWHLVTKLTTTTPLTTPTPTTPTPTTTTTATTSKSPKGQLFSPNKG